MKPQKARNIGAKKWWDSLPASDKTIHSKKYFHTADWQSLTYYSIGHIWSAETEDIGRRGISDKFKEDVKKLREDGVVYVSGDTDIEKAFQWWDTLLITQKTELADRYFSLPSYKLNSSDRVEIWRKETQPSSIGKEGELTEDQSTPSTQNGDTDTMCLMIANIADSYISTHTHSTIAYINLIALFDEKNIGLIHESERQLFSKCLDTLQSIQDRTIKRNSDAHILNALTILVKKNPKI